MTFKQLINSILGPILGSIFGIEVSIKNPREAIKFAKIYFKLNPITAIEVGVFEGENAKSILKNLNIDRIFLIDPYKKYDDYKKEGNCINIVKAKQKAFKRLKRFSNKIIWILDYSSNASKEIKRKVDFVYIDGNHKYKYVKDDLENYWKLIKNGGIMSGHDIQCLDVSKAVIEFCNKNKLELNIGDRRDWWIKKTST